MNYNLKGKKLYVFPLSDLHIGASNCNYDFIDYWKRVFKKTPKNKVIYLLGDLIDFSSKDIGSFDNDMSADEQIDAVTSLLKPYQKYIRYSTMGNHERRAMKYFNLDIGKVIANNLGVPYHNADFFDTLEINNRFFTVYGKHGTKFNQRIDLAEGGMVRDTQNIEADLLMQGHNHYCKGFSRPIVTKNGLKRKYYGFSGHFLAYESSYAHQKNLPWNPEAFIRFSINKNHIVRWNEYHLDERMP